LIVSALAMLALVARDWLHNGFAALPSTLPVVMATTTGAVGLQTVFGGFLLAIIGGHAADFAAEAARPHARWKAAEGDAASREMPAT
jgi:hypothetical protein